MKGYNIVFLSFENSLIASASSDFTKRVSKFLLLAADFNILENSFAALLFDPMIILDGKDYHTEHFLLLETLVKSKSFDNYVSLLNA